MGLVNSSFRLTKRSKNSFLLGIIFSFLVIYPLLHFSAIHRMVSSHSYDLEHEAIYETQFQVYILTAGCRRLTSSIAEAFGNVILVPDEKDSEECAALPYTKLWLEPWQSQSADDAYRAKYAQVLWHCGQGQKMKCLILEDDVVLLHNSTNTRKALVENTLTLFNHEENAYDCTKRGFGWVPSKHTGNGSQCRIYSKPSTGCMQYCLTEYEHRQVDYALRDCQNWCGLSQRRFLLVVHSGFSSVMERKGPQLKEKDQKPVRGG